jgi:DNA-binding response OmpR family regulator
VSATQTLGPRVLLIEDNQDDALLIGRAFKKAGLAAPAHVEDGEAAVAYLDQVAADGARAPVPLGLVLLDLKLPRKPGLEVLAWLRAHAALHRLPVVILTSSREAPDVRRAYDLGANSYLVKPVDARALLHLVETLGLYWLSLNEPPDTGV